MSQTTSLNERLDKLIHNKRSAGRNSSAARNPPAILDAGATREQTDHSSNIASLSAAVVSPPEQVPETVQGPMPEETPLPESALRVLILEADPLHRQVLTRLVESLGYAVEGASTPAEALEALDLRGIALAMLDWDTRELCGPEILARVREIKTAAGRIPVIAITTRTGPVDRDQRQQAGVDSYIAKPFLRANVESVLGRYVPMADRAGAWPYLALDRRRLEELEEVTAGRTGMLREWMALFSSAAPGLLERMREASDFSDAPALAEAASALRSQSGQIGAGRVQELCGIVVTLCGSGSVMGVEALLPELGVALDRAMQELRALDKEIRNGRTLSNARPVASPQRRLADSVASPDILLAEADPLIARFLSNSLTSAGFPVTHVSGGKSALDSAGETQFRVVILNLDVPEVDGYRVLSEMRSGANAATPVMILSARHQEQDILRAFELGADDYVTIPFSPLEVVARVRRLMKQGVRPVD